MQVASTDRSARILTGLTVQKIAFRQHVRWYWNSGPFE